MPKVLHKGVIFGGCLAGVAVIFWLDAVTLVWMSLGIFMLIPIWIAAWYVGENSGYVIATLASIASFVVESLTYPPDLPSWVLAWSASSKTAFFMLYAMLAARLRRSLDHEREISRIDPLTGAATRRVLYEALEQEAAGVRRHRRPLALVYIDLDNFKPVNDEHGHATGDAALLGVATTIYAQIREGEVLARLGGDEFAVLLRDTSLDGARLAAERLRDVLLAAMRARDLPITFSIGVSVYDGGHPMSADQLLVAADAVMYEVKRSSKNAVRVLPAAVPRPGHLRAT